ncbi:hypothetical protein, partial [Flagellimonas marinaquae]
LIGLQKWRFCGGDGQMPDLHFLEVSQSDRSKKWRPPWNGGTGGDGLTPLEDFWLGTMERPI